MLFFVLGDKIKAFPVELSICRTRGKDGNGILVFGYPNPNPDFLNCLNLLVTRLIIFIIVNRIRFKSIILYLFFRNYSREINQEIWIIRDDPYSQPMFEITEFTTIFNKKYSRYYIYIMLVNTVDRPPCVSRVCICSHCCVRQTKRITRARNSMPTRFFFNIMAF